MIYVRNNAVTGFSNHWGKSPMEVKEAVRLYYHFQRLANRAYAQWSQAQENMNRLSLDLFKLFELESSGYDVSEDLRLNELWSNATQAAEIAGLQWFNRYQAASDDILKGLKNIGINFDTLYFEE